MWDSIDDIIMVAVKTILSLRARSSFLLRHIFRLNSSSVTHGEHLHAASISCAGRILSHHQSFFRTTKTCSSVSQSVSQCFQTEFIHPVFWVKCVCVCLLFCWWWIDATVTPAGRDQTLQPNCVLGYKIYFIVNLNTNVRMCDWTSWYVQE